MKKILVIEDGKDNALSKERFTDENELQGYLRKYPDLIPLEEVMDNAPRLVCIGEVTCSRTLASSSGFMSGSLVPLSPLVHTT